MLEDWNIDGVLPIDPDDVVLNLAAVDGFTDVADKDVFSDLRAAC